MNHRLDALDPWMHRLGDTNILHTEIWFIINSSKIILEGMSETLREINKCQEQSILRVSNVYQALTLGKDARVCEATMT